MSKKFMRGALGAAALLLVSCGGIQTLSYDELKPAKLSFPEQIRKVAVVDNTVPMAKTEPGVLTIGRLDGDGRQTVEALAEALADSRYFDQIVIGDSALHGEEQPDVRMLSQEEVGRLAGSLDADIIFSLDRITVETGRKALLYPGLTMPIEVMQTRVTPLLQIYLPDRGQPLYRVEQADSLTWDFGWIFTDKEVQQEASFAAALSLNRLLVPNWMPASRLYFDGGGVEMRDGAVSAREGDWTRAKALWEKAWQGTSSRKKQLKAAFNLALASEMLGDMEAAWQWIEKAAAQAAGGSKEAQACRAYREQLRLRQAELPLLNAQMTRFGQ